MVRLGVINTDKKMEDLILFQFHHGTIGRLMDS